MAVIGLGNISKRHRKNLKICFPDAEVYAISASGRPVTENVCFADHLLNSIEELVDIGMELVIVASPAPYHAKHAIFLIERGVPTLIEKPLDVTEATARQIVLAQERWGTPVAVAYCLRHMPSARMVKSLLLKGVLGQIYNSYVEVGSYLPDWREGKDYRESVSASASLGGGALLELSHEIDYLAWFVGELTPRHSEIRCSKELDLDVEDLVDVVATTQKGGVCNIHLDFLQRHPFRHCHLVGSEARLKWDLMSNEVSLYAKQAVDVVFQEPDWDRNEMYLDMIRDFVSLIEGKPNDCVTLKEALATIRFIDRIKQLGSFSVK